MESGLSEPPDICDAGERVWLGSSFPKGDSDEGTRAADGASRLADARCERSHEAEPFSS